jgi:ferric-dicitrate binding protein FerR (iron transport regulator)
MNGHRIAAIAFGVALVGCGTMGDLREVMALQAAVSKQYGEQTAINLSNGSLLTVTFQNSRYADLPSSERNDFARGVAEFAFAHYARRDSLRSVSVGFRSVKSAGGFSLSTTDAPYSWPAGELRTAADSGEKAPEKSARRLS